MNGLAAAAKPQPDPPAEYRNITLRDLISAYKDAYAKAGFAFGDQIKGEKKAIDGRTVTRIVFELPNKRFPDMKKAVTSFEMLSTGAQGERCDPCSVFVETLSGDLSGYELGEFARFHQEASAANVKAFEHIREKLGKAPMD